MSTQRVTRWADQCREAMRRHGLGHVPVWVMLAQIDTESAGWVRPERHVSGPDFSAEGILQIQPATAQTCGYSSVDAVDGDEYADALRSFDCWGDIQSTYNGDTWSKGWPARYDFPLVWLAGPGTLEKAREFRGNRFGYWWGWYYAAEQTGVTGDYVFSYARTWTDAARKYIGKV